MTARARGWDALNMKFLLQVVFVLSCMLLAVQCFNIQPSHAQTAQPTCRNGWKTTCRVDSGGHTICVTRCR